MLTSLFCLILGVSTVQAGNHESENTKVQVREGKSLKTDKLRAPASLGGQGLEMLEAERLPEPQFLREDGRKNAPKRLRFEADLINPYTPTAQPQIGIGYEADPAFKAD